MVIYVLVENVLVDNTVVGHCVGSQTIELVRCYRYRRCTTVAAYTIKCY